MIQPPFLTKGDKIAIISPARSISFEEVHPSIRLFQRWGLEVVLGINTLGRHLQYSGTDEQRASDLQQMLDDPSIKAIICSRGGYGTVRIIDRINFRKFCTNPKWIIGYSDITVLHSHIHRHFGIETLHATMPVNIKEGDFNHENVEYLRKALFGEKFIYSKPITFSPISGLSKGILIGGNLSILYSLMGTASEIDTNGKILLLEDVDEYLYHIDRMMINLKRAGKLKSLKGLIVGSMEKMRDNSIPYGKNAFEIIAEATASYHYPVCFDFPSGHGKINLPLYFGRMTTLIVDDKIELAF